MIKEKQRTNSCKILNNRKGELSGNIAKNTYLQSKKYKKLKYEVYYTNNSAIIDAKKNTKK
ncbi:hypothetical protein PA25_38240 [Pseudoalteromonas sp. A25]|nr:hypothetical protein PA25_38240 [Pseudoalteromonas sp. A25]